MEASWNDIFHQLFILISALIISAAISSIAALRGFYTLPAKLPLDGTKVRLRHVIIAFALFLTIEVVILPTIYLGWLSFSRGQWLSHDNFQLDSETQTWLNMLGIVLTAIALAIYFSKLDPAVRKQVYGPVVYNSPSAMIKSWLFGSITWFIAYPWIIVVGQLVGIILLFFPHLGTPVDQIAVKHVKDALSHPILLWVTVVAIVAVVPVLEELLFRGFLQTYLKGRFGRPKAIIMTAAIFAFFHYSSSQGAENYELLSALFILACFLGFIREKQQSLWPSIGLHSTFNFASILMILGSGKSISH